MPRECPEAQERPFTCAEAHKDARPSANKLAVPGSGTGVLKKWQFVYRTSFSVTLSAISCTHPWESLMLISPPEAPSDQKATPFKIVLSKLKCSLLSVRSE